MSRKASIAVAASILALSAFSVLSLRAADNAKSPTDAAQPAAAAGEGKGRYYEMRIYTANEGKLEALHRRFREHTNRLFTRHGIEMVGYWTRADQPNTLVFILAYPSKAERDTRWNAFASDPAWKKAKDESEKNGALVSKVEQVFMNPTDYSPVK